MVIFIVLAGLFFFVMMGGIFLNRRRFKFEKIDGTYIYRDDENIFRKNETRSKHWAFGIQKLKGIRTSFRIRYKIPDFYQKIRNKDRQAISGAFVIFGASGFVCCALLAVGMGLLESGETSGWIIITAVILFVLLVILSHRKAVKDVEYSNDKSPD